MIDRKIDFDRAKFILPTINGKAWCSVKESNVAGLFGEENKFYVVSFGKQKGKVRYIIELTEKQKEEFDEHFEHFKNG